MKNLHSARWLIAPALFLAFCSKGNAPTISGPSSLPGPSATVTAGGSVGISADGDVKVGTGTLDFLNLSIWGFNGDPGAGGFVNPGGSYGISAGVEVKLWATYVEGSPANPKFMVDWGDGTEPSAGGCGACKATHTYAIPGLYTVKASLDDRVSTMVTRTFTLDARSTEIAQKPAGATCREIHDRFPTAPSGEYDIGPGGNLRAYCDMETFGGGWTNLNFATNQILLANGNRIDCTGDGGLTQTANSIRCGAPLFNVDGPVRNYLYHYYCSGQDSSMAWLVDHVGVAIGHRESPTLGFSTQANSHTHVHGTSDEGTNREYCYINGELVLWNDARCAPYNAPGNGNCVPGWFTLTR